MGENKIAKRGTVPDPAESGGEAGRDGEGRGRPAAKGLVEGQNLPPEPAGFQHPPVEREAEVADQLLPERGGGAGHVLGQRQRNSGNDLEAIERLPCPLASPAKGRKRDLADVSGSAEPEHHAVGDLAGQFQHR